MHGHCPRARSVFFAYLYTAIEETSLAPHQIVIFVTLLTHINASLRFVSVAHNELLLFKMFFSLLPRLDWLFPRQSAWGSLILGFCLFHTSPVAEGLIE